MLCARASVFGCAACTVTVRQAAMSQPILLQNANCTTRLRLLESRGLVDLDEVWLRSLDAVDSSRVVRQHDAHLR